MQTQRLWLQVTAFLLLVWAGVAAVMWLTEDYVFTPEKTLALMSESPWYENERLGHEQRMQHLDKVITSVVKLDFSQRARMREDGEETIDRFMKSLTDEEKGEYISRTVEENFKAVMKGIEKLGRYNGLCPYTPYEDIGIYSRRLAEYARTPERKKPTDFTYLYNEIVEDYNRFVELSGGAADSTTSWPSPVLLRL